MKAQDWTNVTVGLMAVTIASGKIGKHVSNPICDMVCVTSYLLAGFTALLGIAATFNENRLED